MNGQNQQGMSIGSETAREGLPTADQYSPEKVGTCTLEAGDAQQTYPQYGLELVPVIADGEDTGQRLVRRNGKFVQSVSDNYKLLPNEEAVEAANAVAQELGAEPFHEFDGDWFIELDDHVFQDPDRRRVHAMYAWSQSTWDDGEDLEYGFIVHNSIDTSLQFGVSLFSFRHACANMVFMGINEFPENVEQERDILSSYTRKHTKGFEIEPEILQAQIESALIAVDEIDERYQTWRDTVVTPEIAHQFLDRLPGKDLPDWLADDAVDALEDYAEDNDFDSYEQVDPRRQNQIIEAEIPAGEMLWDTYNDLTESVWHDERTSDTTKRRKFAKIHKAASPSQYVK